MVQKQWWVKLRCLSTDQGGYTTVLLITVFFNATQFKKKQRQFHLRMSLAHARRSTNICRAVKIIDFIKSGPWVHFLKYFVWWSRKYAYSTYAHQSMMAILRKLSELQAGMSFLLERVTDKQTLVIQIWVFGRYFLRKEWNEPVTSRSIQSTRQTNGS